MKSVNSNKKKTNINTLDWCDYNNYWISVLQIPTWRIERLQILEKISDYSCQSERECNEASVGNLKWLIVIRQAKPQQFSYVNSNNV